MPDSFPFPMVKDNALHYCLIIFKKSALLQNFSSHRDKLQQKSDLSLFTPLGDATFPSQESDLRNKWNQHTSENLSIKLSAQLMVIGNNNSMKTGKNLPLAHAERQEISQVPAK